MNAKLKEAKGRGWIKAGSSFDLIVDASTGESWDFLKAEDRRRCWRRLRQEDPWVVIGSPPCTAFSRLQGLSKNRADPEKRRRKMTEAKVLLNFALAVYAWQMQRGRYFAHEHPATATSWSLPEVEAISSARGVSCIVNDACMFGLTAIGRDGREGPARKPTRWTTNVPELVRHLARK